MKMLASQKSVQYSRGGDVCDFCKFFVEDGQDCQKVKGPIYEDMWCKLFKRSSESEANDKEDTADPQAKHIALILVGKPK